jgi:hypothetical protein
MGPQNTIAMNDISEMDTKIYRTVYFDAMSCKEYRKIDVDRTVDDILADIKQLTLSSQFDDVSEAIDIIKATADAVPGLWIR